MTNKHYSDAVECALSDFITPERFRTVLFEQHKQPCGYTEVPVELMLGKESAKKLSFKVGNDGMLYGFARIKPLLAEKFGVSSANAFINDWEDKFIMVFEFDNGVEKAFYITQREVINLLENCQRVPQQR